MLLPKKRQGKLKKLQNLRRNYVEQVALLRQFRKEEDGGLIILTLLLLISMLVVGGMAVDFMRFEAERTKLQSVSDRAVLDAANLNQTRDPSDVMTDFFKAEGYDGAIIGTPEVKKNATGSTVTLNSEIDMDTFFLRLIGMDTLTAPASASAIQGTGNVEVSLILDISGSMGNWMQGPVEQYNEDGTPILDNDGNIKTELEWNTRMFFLQKAAKQFVSDLLLPEYEDRVSINLIAYSQHVRLRDDLYMALKTTPDSISESGATDSSFGSIEDGYALPYDWIARDEEGNPLKDKDGNQIYNVDEDGNPISDPGLLTIGGEDDDVFTNPSRCVTFTDEEYNTLEFDTDRVYQQVELVDFYSSASYFPTGYEPCSSNPKHGIILMSQDVDELHDAIDALNPTLNTSIYRGMKWGVSLLDPSMRDLIATIPTVDDAFRGSRPAEYGSGTTSKYVVIMTDGETVSSRRVLPESYDSYEERYGFSRASGRHYASNDGDGSTTFWNMTESIGTTSELNTKLAQLCDLAGTSMTEVYTISMGVQNQTMTDCASKPGNAFQSTITNDPDEPGMGEIFKKISDQITALRLSL